MIVAPTFTTDQDEAESDHDQDGAGSDEYISAPGSPRDDDEFSPYVSRSNPLITLNLVHTLATCALSQIFLVRYFSGIQQKAPCQQGTEDRDALCVRPVRLRHQPQLAAEAPPSHSLGREAVRVQCVLEGLPPVGASVWPYEDSYWREVVALL